MLNSVVIEQNNTGVRRVRSISCSIEYHEPGHFTVYKQVIDVTPDYTVYRY
jgi:hypothetical protein